MSPWPLAVTLRPLRGQIRTWPPRASLSVAGAMPADNSEPESTLIPDPASCMALELPVSEAKSSPIGGVFCAAAGVHSKRNAAHPGQAAFFTMADRLFGRTRYS